MFNYIFAAFFILIAFFDISSFYEINPTYTRVAPKWLSLYLLASAGIILLLFKKQFKMKAPAFLKYFYGAYILGIFLTLASAPLGYFERSLSEKFLFLSIALISNNVFFEETTFLSKLRRSIFFGTPIIYFFVFYYLATTKLKLFDNTHHFSELLAITTLIQGYFIFLTPGQSKKRFEKMALFEITIFLVGIATILILKSRTAVLGSIVGLSFYAFVAFKEKTNKTKTFPSYIVISIAILFCSFTYLNLQAGKMKSLNIRLARWENTVAMIKDYPLGVGLGNFFSAYSQYQNKTAIDNEAQEGWILENPHNFFLENAAEEGILNTIILLLTICLLLYGLFKLKNIGSNVLLKGLTSFLIIDALFNYPQDTPYTFFIAAFCLGGICFKLTTYHFQLLNIHKVTLIGICSIFLIYLPTRYYVAYFIASSPAEEPSRKACALDDQVWFACLNALTADWNRENRDEALSKLSKLNRRFIGFYALQKKEIEFLWKAGKKKEACDEAENYNALFNGKSSLNKFSSEACRGLSDY